MAVKSAKSRSMSQSMSKNWEVAARIAELTGRDVRQCRRAATLFLKDGNDLSDLKNVHLRTAEKLANKFVTISLVPKIDHVLIGGSDNEEWDNHLSDSGCDSGYGEFGINPSQFMGDLKKSSMFLAQIVGTQEYDFDYSLVQTVAELSKQHGYNNVREALELYNNLVEGL